MDKTSGKRWYSVGERQLIPLTDTYIDEMIAIEEASFSTPWSKQAYLQELHSNPIAFYIACVENGHLLGYAGIWLIADEGHISNIAVHPDYRGQGIGKAMLQALILYCQQKHCSGMTLEVRESNRTAIHLYEKMGFRAAGKRPHYYSDNNEDAIIYWLFLEEKK